MNKSLRLLILFSVAFYAPESFGQKIQSPNIIFILADDLGWSSLSCSMDPGNAGMKSDYHNTPNLERLAREGMRFSRGYAAASICSPSRRSILYGQTPTRLGDGSFERNYQPTTGRCQTLPFALKSIDPRYKAAHFGKWDMRAGFFPEDAGYDESDGNTGNRHGDLMTDKDDKWTTHFLVEDPKKMHTITARAINFMERQVKSGSPFYMQISHYATHVDLQARRETYDKYKAKPVGVKDRDPAFAAMLEDLDTSIGEVMEKIKSLGIGHNTFVFFMADNGATEFLPPVKNRLDHPDSFDMRMRNHPLRGGKWTLYEGGIRVPLIVRGPGIAANSHCDIPVVGWDLLPTFAELAGASPVGETPDGRSFADLLKNNGHEVLQRAAKELVFHRYNNAYPHSALIDGDYKVIKFWKSDRLELYNLRKDIGERQNLASLQKGKAKELETRLIRYMNNVNPDLIGSYIK